MTFIKDTFFGGAEKKAGQAEAAAAEQGQEFVRAGVEQARGDVTRLFPEARQDIQQSFQGALDVFGQALPAQTQAFQQGNIGAQQQILAGLPQFQNAILGGQVDFSQLQPFEQQLPDLGFFQQQLPQFQQPSSAVDIFQSATASGRGGFPASRPRQLEPGEFNPLGGGGFAGRFNDKRQIR